MKSRITVEVDFDNGNQPVLQILSHHSNDVRDRLLSVFLQSLAHTSRWATVQYVGSYDDHASNSQEIGTSGNAHRWIIKPVPPEQLAQEIQLMQAVSTATQ